MYIKHSATKYYFLGKVNIHNFNRFPSEIFNAFSWHYILSKEKSASPSIKAYFLFLLVCMLSYTSQLLHNRCASIFSHLIRNTLHFWWSYPLQNMIFPFASLCYSLALQFCISLFQPILWPPWSILSFHYLILPVTFITVYNWTSFSYPVPHFHMLFHWVQKHCSGQVSGVWLTGLIVINIAFKSITFRAAEDNVLSNCIKGDLYPPW